jgi:PPOX class probable F420-dependent enzyme
MVQTSAPIVRIWENATPASRPSSATRRGAPPGDCRRRPLQIPRPASQRVIWATRDAFPTQARVPKAGTGTSVTAAHHCGPRNVGRWPYDPTVIDQSTEFGARVARHLREEIVVWLTSVTRAGSPLPSPVWFLWDGAESVVMYSLPGARVRNIEANSRVALNFAGDGRGGDIVVLSGSAAVDAGAPSADAASDYRAKYDAHIARIGMTPETFAQRYSVPVRIHLTDLRGH